jgi:hypothetical protein
VHKKRTFTGKKLKFRITLLLFTGVFMLYYPASVFAQEITAEQTDTVMVDSTLRTHSVRKAVVYSLICPGLGQAYNKKYWKIPFIYGAGGTFLYFVGYNQMKYKKFKDALYEGQTTENVIIDGYTYRYSSLGLARDYYRRYRDLSIAGFAAIYLLNVIDAMVDATFYYYDISDDLSLKVEPAVIENTGLTGTTASLGLSIRIGF